MATAALPEVNQPSKTLSVDPRAELGKHYEIVYGQFTAEPPLGARESLIASVIDQILGAFARSHRLGRVAAETLFILQHEPRLRRRPDVAFVSAERWSLTTPVPPGAAWDVVPDLAIEVISPTDLATEVQSKIAEYSRAGVRLVWIVYVATANVLVYESITNVRVLKRADTIDGGTVLPGLQIPLTEVFETEADEPLSTGDE